MKYLLNWRFDEDDIEFLRRKGHFGEDFLGFGFDIDGTGGKYPIGINTAGSIHEQIAEILYSRYSAETTEKICGGNTVEFFSRNL